MQSRAAVGRWRGPPFLRSPQHRADLVSGDRSRRARSARSTPPPSPPRPVVDALYSDPETTALLRRYRIPRRHRSGGITDPLPRPGRASPRGSCAPLPGHRAGRGTHRGTHRIPADQVPDLLHGTASRSGATAATPPGTAVATPPPAMPRPRQPRPIGPKRRRRPDAGAGPGPRTPASDRPIVDRGVCRPLRAPAPGGGVPRRGCPVRSTPWVLRGPVVTGVVGLVRRAVGGTAGFVPVPVPAR